MKRRKIYFAIALAVSSLSALSGQNSQVEQTKKATPNNRTLVDWQWVVDRALWNDSYNFKSLPITLSKVELQGDYQSGDYRDYSDASKSIVGGLSAQSYSQTKQTQFYGMLEYDYFRGRDMCGSMMVNPREYPLNLMEFTPGTKNRERYHLKGNVSHSFSEMFAVSGGIDYRSTNYAKRKDLRHKNSKMDLEASLGATLAWGKSTVGASYIYGRKSEDVVAEVVGSTSQSYDAFLDKGLWYGVGGLWTDSGIHLQNTGTGITGFPLTDWWNGAAVQYAFEGERFALFNQFAFKWAKGKTGDKGVEWSKSNKTTWQDELKIRVNFSPRLSNLLTLNASFDDMDNFENVLGRETVGGVTQTYIYASNLIYQQRELTLSATNDLYIDANDSQHPQTVVSLGFDYHQTGGISSLMFPTYINRDVATYAASTAIRRTVWRGKNQFEWRLAATYATGNGRRTKSYTDSTDLLPGNYPTQPAEYALYDWEWLTSSKINGGAHLRYGRSTKTKLLPYIDLGYSLTHCLDKLTYIKGNNRHTLSMTLGLRF